MPEYYVILLCGKILIGHTHWTRQWCCIITHATKQRQYTAWYTLDVPISYGPYKFFGLPGLIIKIEESTGMYIWEMYSLSVSATPIHIYQYEKEQKCTEESAARTIHRMMTTPMTFLSSAGSRVLVRQNDGSFGSPAKDEKGMPYEPIELR